MRRLVPILAAAIAIVLLAPAAQAHDLFLRLRTYFVPPNTPVVVRVLNGSFVSSEGTVQRNRLRDLSLVAQGVRRALDSTAWTDASRKVSTLTLRTGAPGTYVVGASTKPKLIQLAAKDFNGYLDHDGVPDILAARTRAGELEKPARERYHKHVKAILQVGAAHSDDWKTVLGYPAELVPESNPYAARPGDTLAFRCLVDGAASASQFVMIGYDGGNGRVIESGLRADASGVVRVPLARRGKWFVKFIHMEPVQDSVDYESKWASLTFEIR
jgi:hypothetical protein